MFGTSYFGIGVTWTPSYGLRHQMLNSVPSSIETLTSVPCKILTCAEVDGILMKEFSNNTVSFRRKIWMSFPGFTISVNREVMLSIRLISGSSSSNNRINTD